ncbi:16522_t:CDS:2, partial [Funneliformis mosseae]
MIPLKENLRELGLGNSGLSMYIGSRIFAMFVIQYSDPITSVPRIISINLSPFTAKSAMRTSRILSHNISTKEIRQQDRYDEKQKSYLWQIVAKQSGSSCLRFNGISPIASSFRQPNHNEIIYQKP